ncbi:MAG: hypothetical protein HQL82_02575 [Magnetococcales bacterium]|nr:hypothetical protein [Magnetococcales bacterium]
MEIGPQVSPLSPIERPRTGAVAPVRPTDSVQEADPVTPDRGGTAMAFRFLEREIQAHLDRLFMEELFERPLSQASPRELVTAPEPMEEAVHV